MQDLNTVALVGRLTSDPELRQLASGTALCSMRIAFNTSQRDGQEWVDKANFISVTVWGNHAETCNKYLAKGKRVALQGRLQYREWETDSGATRSTIEIVAERVQFIEPRSDNDSRPAQTQSAPPPPVSDDDIPF